MAGTMAKEMIDLWNHCSIKTSILCRKYHICTKHGEQMEFKMVYPVRLRLRLQTLPSSYTSTSQMPLFLRGSLVRHRHRGKSRRPDGRSIPRISQALAQEHGRVEVTVPRQGSALARAPDHPPVAALSHAQSYVCPACPLDVSRPTGTKAKHKV
jgi:hypothetical protein